MTTSTFASSKISPEQAYEIGSQAYCYFYPLITMEVTRRQMTNLPAGQKMGFGPANSFVHARTFPDADFKVVVRPNFDTLYSSAWLDLSKEPLIISIPDTNGRYYLLPMLDMWTDVFASPGWRTSGTQAQNYAIVSPGWRGNLPEGVLAIQAPTTYVWVIGRLKTDGPDDYKNVNALQDALKITPLSNWGKASNVVPATVIDESVDMKTPPLEFVNAMSVHDYFSMAAQLLKANPAHLTDWSMIARLETLGFVAGKEFDLNKLDKSIQEEFIRGAKDCLALMLSKIKSIGRVVNGWSMNTDSMGVYGNYYLKRAIVSMVGLGANQPEDAVYPLNLTDKDGNLLSGDKNYVIHFEKDAMPQAHAFWSVTMYDAAGFQVANELNRFAVSSWMPFVKNQDGSLDIYIQHENPGKDKEANWLPAPASGVLGVTMRLYAPYDTVLNGDWVPPAIKLVK
ncbi:MAG: DUF1254 domain-containing protein [Candidatus Melainabacteria bacterium]|nr:DUF1254 domain-containing protein [Candidatus Melainabacteria bacterium]